VPQDEGQHLQTVFPTAKQLGGFGHFGFNPASRLTEDSVLATAGNRERLWKAWSPYWDLSRPVLLEKSPPNITRTRFLQALFPGALFVVIVRHPIPVAYSQRRPGRVTLDTLLRHWLFTHELFREDEGHLKDALVVKYEDFTRAPQAVVDAICARLGLPSYPLGAAVTNENEKHFRRWRRYWDPLMAMYRAWLIRRYERGVTTFGYSLLDLNQVGPWPSSRPGSAG
jgi:hypothetical protein